MFQSSYNYLIGKDKTEIKNILGQEFNYFHSSLWTYHLKTTNFGLKYFLLVHYKEEVVKYIDKENLWKKTC